jgi:hypothetical protein
MNNLQIRGHAVADAAPEKMTMTSVCLPPELHARLLRYAGAQRRSISSTIRILVEDHIPDNGPIAINGGQR